MRTSVLLVLFIIAQACLCAQPNFYFGPLFSLHIPVLSPEGGVDGSTRSGAGAVFAIPFGKKAELRVHGMYRSESGEFTTYPVVQQPGTNVSIHQGGDDATMQRGAQNASTIDVVEPGARPYIQSDISLRAVELGVSYWLRLVAIDTMGTNLFIGAGILADRILSGEQVDNYAHADVPATDPVERSYIYDGQFGGGGFLGASLVFPIGDGRLGFDLTYAMRWPGEIEGQNIEWLTGRNIRIAAHYDFGL